MTELTCEEGSSQCEVVQYETDVLETLINQHGSSLEFSDDSVEVLEGHGDGRQGGPLWANPLAPPACFVKPVSRTIITES